MVEIAEFLNESNMSGKHRIMYNVNIGGNCDTIKKQGRV